MKEKEQIKTATFPTSSLRATDDVGLVHNLSLTFPCSAKFLLPLSFIKNGHIKLKLPIIFEQVRKSQVASKRAFTSKNSAFRLEEIRLKIFTRIIPT